MDSIWLEIAINTKSEELEALSARLIANGVTGFVVEEEEEFLSFLEENRQYWDYVDDELMEQMKGVSRVKLYVTDDQDGQAQLAQYLKGIDLPYTSVPLREYDWAHSWQKYYRPLAIGKKLYIVPEWERDTAAIPEGATRLLLNPGLTFGTGSHASTQLCLEGLEDYTVPGAPVLDLGCGSGILAIAALRLGASHAVGVDIDPKAVDVAYENAALNDIGKDRCRFLAGNVLDDDGLVRELAQEKAPLVLANIVADVIIPLAPLVPTLLAPGGTFLCSGIIDQRGDEVAAALNKAGLTVIRRMEKNGWIALAAKIEPIS
ncbi:MAG: 50S ribosomal protein L11 methyltransferase [Evtepia sp.]|uniref:50S ribosomal protein L11 methyltransferase n=1 Tax=Evtepia sp. TaxID=2773933 RepID=UPI002A75707F|nr:50S ribosomal protein L11 methyltransferase [Evtepia sp.]MDY3014632.1 50S ribosomal protein L11 methyltransferase [Evtepia sp.]